MSVIYDIAVSFAGEHRQYVEATVRACQRLGISVFYDRDKDDDWWGKSFIGEQRVVYGSQARHFIAFISPEYFLKPIPRDEYRSAMVAAVNRGDDYILPVVIGSPEIPPELLHPDTLYLKAADYGPEELAAVIQRKVRRVTTANGEARDIGGFVQGLRGAATDNDVLGAAGAPVVEKFTLPELLRLSSDRADVLLYDGPAFVPEFDLDCDLKVTGSCATKDAIRWWARFNVDLPALLYHYHESLTFVLKSQDGYLDAPVDQMSVTGHSEKTIWGEIDGNRMVGATEHGAALVRAGWVNLTDVGSGERIELPTGGIENRHWFGRQRWHIDPWVMTIEPRPDLREVVAGLKKSRGYTITHCATIERSDASPFTGAEVTAAVHAYQLAVSFALGRWVSPAFPVAVDSQDKVVWREWARRKVDPVGGAISWWHVLAAPMNKVTTLLGPLILDPHVGRNVKHVIQSYLSSAGGGVVEQRIVAGTSAAELICWAQRPSEDVLALSTFESLGLAGRLGAALKSASVEVEIPEHLPALIDFARGHGLQDGPSVIAAVWEQIVRPRDLGETYDHPGLIVETWRILSHYLELLILRWMGYTGKVHDTSAIPVWSGDVRTVPWVKPQ